MTEDQFNTLNAKLDALIKCMEVSATYYNQSTHQLREIINMINLDGDVC